MIDHVIPNTDVVPSHYRICLIISQLKLANVLLSKTVGHVRVSNMNAMETKTVQDQLNAVPVDVIGFVLHLMSAKVCSYYDFREINRYHDQYLPVAITS